ILRNYDGVDNDIEKATQSSTNKVNMTAFQQQLYNTFKSSNSNYRISIAIGAYYPDSDQCRSRTHGFHGRSVPERRYE
ncbi:MAG: hypothetical protein O8C63_01370, partial [Candidatus Methanoperedens sp.]|nr:hypothetical protein [Candidatus Methanoperedens sp.]